LAILTLIKTAVFIDNAVYHGSYSILRFIEYNWGLGPLNTMDKSTNNMINSFNFKESPLPPIIFGPESPPLNQRPLPANAACFFDPI
jgi:hypothetical protein